MNKIKYVCKPNHVIIAKRYFKLVYHAHLDCYHDPMMEVDAEPPLRQLHDEINSIIMNRQYYDEIVDKMVKVLNGKLGAAISGTKCTISIVIKKTATSLNGTKRSDSFGHRTFTIC